MKPSLLFIDDEYSPNEATLHSLNEHFVVDHQRRAREGLNALVARTDWAVAVVDMMMAAPQDWWVETEEGQYTGLKILSAAKDHLVEHRIPVLLFTNRNLDALRPRLEALDFPSGLLERREKDKQSAEEIVRVIRNLADKWANGSHG